MRRRALALGSALCGACFALCHWQVGRVRRAGHFQALKCRGRNPHRLRAILGFLPLPCAFLWAKGFGRCALRGLVSNYGLSGIALHIVTRAVRFSANGSATLGNSTCFAHCQFQESIVPRVLRGAHVPLAVCRSRSSAPCTALYFAPFKARSPCTGARMRPHWTGETALCRPSENVVVRFVS